MDITDALTVSDDVEEPEASYQLLRLVLFSLAALEDRILMHTVMAVAAERYEVFWAVRAAIRAPDDMMDLKDLALRFPSAYPAFVSISIEYVFSGIPEA